MCGTESKFTVPEDGTELTVQLLDGNTDFTYNSLCTYEIELPSSGVNEYDQLLVYAQDVVNADIYISVGTSFDSYSMAEVLLEKGAGVYILTPNKAFVSVVSYDNNIISSFELYTSINRRDGEDLTEEDKGLEIEFVYNLRPGEISIN